MSITEFQYQAQTVEAAPEQAIEGRSQWQLTWRRLRSDKVAVFCVIVILLMCAMAIFAPALAALTHHGTNQVFPNLLPANGLPLSPGSHGFLFGSDEQGRDLLVRIAYGARISLFVGIGTTIVGIVAGVTVGMVSGYFGGTVDAVLARFVDAVLAFPVVVLGLSLAAVFGPSLTIVFAVIAFFSWAGIARIVRGQVLAIKEKEYIEAARSLGAGPWRIMFIDILPNLMAPVLVLATLSIPAAIVFEATLSFLGIGVQLPTASWGDMLQSAQNYYQVAWWYLVFPAVALLIITLAFNLLGDGIRDALDPRTERIFAARRDRTTRRSLRRGTGPASGHDSASPPQPGLGQPS